ncbi:MAG: FGGY-family carbohydrate kinase, partial [Pseudomonadota bacterium]|nr:FGGY-family carbohydrate kinase [Pseudomonadota bacterium]
MLVWIWRGDEVLRECILGIDAGGTAIKATLYSVGGQEIATESVLVASRMVAPGRAERDLADIDQALVSLIQGLLQKSRTNPHDIEVIAATGHGNGLYCLDRSGAGMLGIQSTDSRAAMLADTLANSSVGLDIAEISLQLPWPAQTPTILAALKQTQPELYDRIGTVFFCKDYINYFLTSTISTEVTDMGGAGMLQLPETRYSDALLEHYGIVELAGSLPPLVASDQVIGVVSQTAAGLTGLVSGTPVVAGLFDVVSSAIGSGLLYDGETCVIAGTWSINEVLSSDVRRENRPFITCGFPGGLFLNLEASATSASNFEWLVQNILVGPNGGPNERERIVSALDSVLRSHEISLNDPLYLPFLHGGDSDPRALATFHNLAATHDRNHLISAVCEGITFSHRRHLDTLAEKGFSIGPIVVTGGAARSQPWMRMLATTLGKPVATVETTETGTLGAAITGAVGVGIFADYPAAALAMVGRRHEILGDLAGISMASQRYEMFNRLVETLTPLWHSFPNKT